MTEISKQIKRQSFFNRENAWHHHRYRDELEQYYAIAEVNPKKAAELGRKMFTSTLTGNLSKNVLRDK